MGRTKGSKNKSKLIIKDTVEVIQEAESIIEEIKTTKEIRGWVNIFKHVNKQGHTSYYTGSDIYPSKEAALKHRLSITVDAVEIVFHVKI